MYSALREANIPEDKALATVLAFEERFKNIDERFNRIDLRFSQLEAKLEKLETKMNIMMGIVVAILLMLINLSVRR